MFKASFWDDSNYCRKEGKKEVEVESVTVPNAIQNQYSIIKESVTYRNRSIMTLQSVLVLYCTILYTAY